jgi:hypothetical protein
MCLPDASTPRRSQILRSIGLLCLAASLASQSMSLSFGLPSVPLHFVRGLLLGLGCTLILFSLYSRRRRCALPARHGSSGSQL